MLTFRELKELLNEAPEMDRVPSMRELMRTGTVFMERPVVNGVVTVFTNGLALFEEFDRSDCFLWYPMCCTYQWFLCQAFLTFLTRRDESDLRCTE